MKIIIGLGNPGTKYVGTRHNIGFSVIDDFSKQVDITKKERKSKCTLQFGELDGTEIVLVKPRTFINNSGIAIKYLIDRFNIGLSDLLIIYDDVALPVGKIRIRGNGTSGGHNGIKSIIESTGGYMFPRLRIGVGSPDSTDMDLVAWVLGKFEPEEQELVTKTLAESVSAILFWINHDINLTMNTFN